MNTGYPQAASERKEHDALMLQNIKRLAQTNLIDTINQIDSDFMAPIYQKHDVFDYIFKNGTDRQLVTQLKTIMPTCN